MFRLLELGKPVAELTEEDLAYIGRFATVSASLSTEHIGGIPSIQKKSVILERMQHDMRERQ